MTDICACLYPIWIYDNKDNEYFAMPSELLAEMGIKKQEGDIEVIINRDDRDIKFLAVPFNKDIGNRKIPIPETETIDYNVNIGKDTVSKQFLKLTWQRPENLFIKKYDVRDHIFVAGCENSETSKEFEFDETENKEKEVLKCTSKYVYEILHPMDEFLEKHIEELENLRIV